MEALTFLVTTTDNSVISNIKTILAPFYPNAKLVTASNPNEIWENLGKYSIDIIIYDNESQNIDGFELCKKLHKNEKYKKIYFILLINHSSKEFFNKTPHESVDDIITKPIDTNEFLLRIRSAVRITQMQKQLSEEHGLLLELAEALEKQLNDTKQLAIKLISLRFPILAELTQKIATASVWVAKLMGNFNQDELEEIELASHLAYSGKLCLPDNLLEEQVLSDGIPTNELMFQVPIKSKEILSSISSFTSTSAIVYHIFENFDGSGIPQKLQSWQIPAQSRIIRVALDYAELRYFKKQTPEEALTTLKNYSRRLYDPKVVTFFEQFLYEYKEIQTNVEENPVALQDLEEGMTLSRDITTYSGVKLLPAGAVLTSKSIQMILTHNTTDPILGNVYVKV
jgi:response regulator RpfG family c-di-GMP phosphodiesterase